MVFLCLQFNIYLVTGSFPYQKLLQLQLKINKDETFLIKSVLIPGNTNTPDVMHF